MRDLWAVALVVLNAYFLIVAVSNVVYLRRATSAPRVTSGSFVSVIVPARDEEGSIARCVESLLAQDYTGFEVIVVDDQSSDATAGIVAALAARDGRVRLVRGVPLRDGWLGKAHALSQGAAVARGEVLILTDADTVHTPHSISWAVTNLQDHDADILSGYLEQMYGSFGESLIVPTMYAEMLLVPLFLVPRVKSPRTAFAIGQYVAMRREALDGVGGFEPIKGSIVDDMSMAIRMKEFGYRNVFLDARQAASCRLYTSYRSAFAGISRSIYSAIGGHPVPAVAVGAIVLGVIVWPAVAAVAPLLRLALPAPLVALPAALFAIQWACVAWDRDVPLTGFLLYPFVFANLVAILGESMLRTGFGRGLEWKGRAVRASRDVSTAAEPHPADAAGKER